MCCNIFLFSRVLHLTIGLDFRRGSQHEELDKATVPIIALPSDPTSRLARLKYFA